VGPFPEIVQQSGGGILFDTPFDLATALETLQHDTTTRTALGRAGYDAYQRYWSESAVVPRYIDLIETTCARRQARAS
jgi:glycosyltransferase involved in cell wall biosynthesis